MLLLNTLYLITFREPQLVAPMREPPLGAGDGVTRIVFLREESELESDFFLFLEALMYAKLGFRGFGLVVTEVVHLGWSRIWESELFFVTCWNWTRFLRYS